MKITATPSKNEVQLADLGGGDVFHRYGTPGGFFMKLDLMHPVYPEAEDVAGNILQQTVIDLVNGQLCALEDTEMVRRKPDAIMLVDGLPEED